MAWINATSVGVLILAGVAVMGVVPTSVGLSNGIDVGCRAVLAPVSGAGVSHGLSAEQYGAVEAWLDSQGSSDPNAGSASAEEWSRMGSHVADLCAEAQRTRSLWMTLTAVFGLAAAFALRSWGTSSDVPAVQPEQKAG